MGNRVSCMKGKNEQSSAITLAIIGPDDAGKTTLSSVLAGEPMDPHVSPTVGFRNVKFTIKKFDVTLYDLGGGKNIRPIWKNYFNEIYGIVYMVDSSSPARLKEARDLLRDTLEHPQVSGKPLLVLANKADVDGHMEEVDILNQLDLDQTVNVMISALQSSKAKMKKVVIGGFMWLLGTIGSSMESLEPRVKEDMRAVKEMRDKEREERRERVRKQREEREKEEERERRRLGIPKEHESDEEEMKGDPFKPLDYNQLRLKDEKLKAEKRNKQLLAAGKLGLNERTDLQRIRDDAKIGYSMDDTMTLPRFGRERPRYDGPDIIQSSSLMSQGRNTRPSALPPLDPIVSHSLDSKLSSADKKKGKKKPLDPLPSENGMDALRNAESDLMGRSEFSLYGSRSFQAGRHDPDNQEEVLRNGRDDMLRRSYHGSRSYGEHDDREGLRNERDDSMGRLDLSHYGSRSYTEADVHDLTPRVAKPRNTKVIKAGRIEEDDKEVSLNQYKNMRMSLKEYGDPRMSQKLDEYGDKYPLRSSSDTKPYRSVDNRYSSSQTNNNDRRPWDKTLDRETSAYRKSLKNISPPDMGRFDDDNKEEDKDEGIEEDSDNGSEDLGRYSRSSAKHGSYGRANPRDSSARHNQWKDVNANKRHTQYSDEAEDEEDEYRSKNTLKDTLKFSRHEDSSRKNYEKELSNLKYRRDNDYKSGHNRERYMDSDDERLESQTPDQSDQRRKKKKKSILKSNKLLPSDDDEGDMPSNHRYSSPRLVQEHGSRNTSDADTPSKRRNSRTTYFHKGSSRDSDLSRKWGLAEDLPSIDNDSRVHRNIRPNFDDSEGEDVVF